MSANHGWLRRLDDAIYRMERGAVVACTAAMVLVVFAAVVWETFAGPAEGSPWPAFAAWLLICGFAVHTARPRWSLVATLAASTSLAVGAWGAAELWVWLLPNGVVWGQKVALALMMWMVFLGASMAAHERRHILVQAAQKLVPSSSARWHSAGSLLVAAAFTAFLALLGAQYAWQNYLDWSVSDHRAALFQPTLGLPNWAVTLSIPIGLGLCALRFAGHAVGVARGSLPPTVEQGELASLTEDGAP